MVARKAPYALVVLQNWTSHFYLFAEAMKKSHFIQQSSINVFLNVKTKNQTEHSTEACSKFKSIFAQNVKPTEFWRFQSFQGSLLTCTYDFVWFVWELFLTECSSLTKWCLEHWSWNYKCFTFKKNSFLASQLSYFLVWWSCV